MGVLEVLCGALGVETGSLDGGYLALDSVGEGGVEGRVVEPVDVV